MGETSFFFLCLVSDEEVGMLVWLNTIALPSITQPFGSLFYTKPNEFQSVAPSLFTRGIRNVWMLVCAWCVDTSI